MTLETVNYAPEIAREDPREARRRAGGRAPAGRDRVGGREEEADLRGGRRAEAARDRDRGGAEEARAPAEQGAGALELEKEAEPTHFKAEQELATLETQKKVTQGRGARSDRLRAQAEADSKIIAAKAEAEAAKQMAARTPRSAAPRRPGSRPWRSWSTRTTRSAHLGGTGTTIVLGDWAHVPSFLFPRVPSLQSAFTLPLMPMRPRRRRRPLPSARTRSASPTRRSRARRPRQPVLISRRGLRARGPRGRGSSSRGRARCFRARRTGRRVRWATCACPAGRASPSSRARVGAMSDQPPSSARAMISLSRAP